MMSPEVSCSGVSESRDVERNLMIWMIAQVRSSSVNSGSYEMQLLCHRLFDAEYQ